MSRRAIRKERHNNFTIFEDNEEARPDGSQVIVGKIRDKSGSWG